MFIELAPVWRSAPDLNHTRYIIDLIRLQCPDTMPAIISADDPVIQSDRTIERQIHVPLHVAVHTEKLSKIIHPEIRRVPTTGANAFPTSAALIKSKYGSGALKQNRGGLFGDMGTIFNPSTITCNKVYVTIKTPKQRMGGMVPSGVKSGSKPPLMLKSVAALIPRI